MSGLTAPGLIDLQINGAYGHDFTSNPATIWEVGARLPEHGVTAFLPTIITAPNRAIEVAREALRSRPANYVGAEPLGLHLEGPMISREQPGVHDPLLIRDNLAGLGGDWDDVRMVTLAPELPGAEAVVKELVGAGVRVFAGHSQADFDQALMAFGWGVSGITHLFNAMTSLSHRAPGLVGAAFDRRVVATVICDGVHVHPAALRAAWRLLRPDRLVLVTDAMAAAGLGDGVYRLGGAEVQVRDDQAKDGRGRLAGSTLTLDQAIRNLVAFTDATPEEAVAAASTLPAQVLGLGERNDEVVFDDSLQVVTTRIAGKVVWRR